jgi:hypothetical protein
MNMEQLANENSGLKEEMALLNCELERIKQDLVETKAHLKKYTAPVAKKLYYELNKESIKLKVKEYKETTNYTPTVEQKKTWARTAYLKRKEQLENKLNIIL